MTLKKFVQEFYTDVLHANKHGNYRYTKDVKDNAWLFYHYDTIIAFVEVSKVSQTDNLITLMVEGISTSTTKMVNLLSMSSPWNWADPIRLRSSQFDAALEAVQQKGQK